jgi:hypothetical protein
VYTYTLGGTQEHGNTSATQQSGTKKGKLKTTSQPLFLDSDSEPEPGATLLNDDFDSTLKSTSAPRMRTTQTRVAKGKGKAKDVVPDFEETAGILDPDDSGMELIDENLVEVGEDSSPNKSGARKFGKLDESFKGKRAKKGMENLLVDDDSDDGMTFGRRKALRNKR